MVHPDRMQGDHVLWRLYSLSPGHGHTVSAAIVYDNYSLHISFVRFLNPCHCYIEWTSAVNDDEKKMASFVP